VGPVKTLVIITVLFISCHKRERERKQRKMAAEVDTTDYEKQIDADKRLNKTEKKARKALAALGLKAVPNVSRVTMKKQPNILFLVSDAEVFKSPAGAGQEIYVVYGQTQIDDGNRRGGVPSYMPPAGAETEMPAMTPAASAASSEDVSADGLSEKDIEMVMTQANVDRAKAIQALKKNGGDIVNSIMDLTM